MLIFILLLILLFLVIFSLWLLSFQNLFRFLIILILFLYCLSCLLFFRLLVFLILSRFVLALLLIAHPIPKFLSQNNCLLNIFIIQNPSSTIIIVRLLINQLIPMGKVLFPSRPKPQSTFNNSKPVLDKERQKQKKVFIDTIKDMKKMVQKHFGSYHKDTLGMLKTNTKVPYTHLMGRRNKIIERYSTQKARARQQNIQYDSSLHLLNSNIVEKSKKQKDDFIKNKYKYEGQNLSSGRLGRQSAGMLTLSKKDINRINGKQFKAKQKNQGQASTGFKHKKVRKGKKGKK